MSVRWISTKVVFALVASAGLAAGPRLPAGWGFAAGWDILQEWGVLDGTAGSGVDLFGMTGQYPAIALGLDDDCDSFFDMLFFLGDSAKAEELYSTLPTEEVAFLGGVLTKKGWSGVTFIDPANFQDMILLSYGDPPAGYQVTAPIVIDIRETALEKASPVLYKGLGFLLAASQGWATRYEWDFDLDGVIDRVGYWGQNGPVFLDPGIIPGGGQSILAVVDDNSPAKTSTYYVGGCLPPEDTLGPGKVVIPNSNMGFKLNLVAIEDTGGDPGLFSNMGFKLNYTIWQGGDPDSGVENWWGHCNAWAMSSWILVPEESTDAQHMVHCRQIHACTAAAAFDGDKRTDGCEVNMDTPPPMEEVSLSFSGSGRMALFLAVNGWSPSTAELSAQSARIDGFGPAAVALLDGEEWSLLVTRKVEEEIEGGSDSSEEDIVFLTPKGHDYIGAISRVNFEPGAEGTAWQWDRETNTWLSLLAGAEDHVGLFVRGETNLDSLAGPDISDAIFILQWLFVGGREPLCLDAADVNDDGTVDISDGIALLSFLFAGGTMPGSPFPDAGPDPTPDGLGCDLMR